MSSPGKIPSKVIGSLASIIDRHYTRKQFAALFLAVGAPAEEPIVGNKIDTVIQWLRRTNIECVEPLKVLAGILDDFFDGNPRNSPEALENDRESLRKNLESAGLRYISGSVVSVGSVARVTRSLEELLRVRDFPAVMEEFERATAAIETNPREAASAAANILEAICKEYLVQHPRLLAPKKKDLGPVFEVLRTDLGLDPASIEDEDLRRVLGGIGSIVDGIGAFRTHASSAHAQNTSKRRYRITSRHARLVVGAAHVLVVFLIETWASREA